LSKDTAPIYSLFPSHFSLLVCGPPGVGKFEWLGGLVRTYLTAGERVVFVTLDMHPREVRERAKAIGLDLGRWEGSSFLFVDCYSANASEKLDEPPAKKMYSVSSYSNLEGLGMAISKAATDLRPPLRVFFYTVSTLFLHNSPQAIAKFFQIVTNRVKTNIGFIGYAVHEGVHDPLTMNLLRSLVDGVVELRFNEAMGREVRAHHLRGIASSPAWQPFEIAEG